MCFMYWSIIVQDKVDYTLNDSIHFLYKENLKYLPILNWSLWFSLSDGKYNVIF